MIFNQLVRRRPTILRRRKNKPRQAGHPSRATSAPGTACRGCSAFDLTMPMPVATIFVALVLVLVLILVLILILVLLLLIV